MQRENNNIRKTCNLSKIPMNVNNLKMPACLPLESKKICSDSLICNQQPVSFSFQFIASYVWYSMENLAGDLLLGLKFVKLPIES